MATKVRKQIYIEPEQEERLKRLAAETGVAEAEIIRDAIDQHLLVSRSPRRNLSAWQAELAFIRQLIQAGPVQGGRTWRRDDLYDH